MLSRVSFLLAEPAARVGRRRSPNPRGADLAIHLLCKKRLFRPGRPLSTVSISAGPVPLRGHSPATAALFLRRMGGQNSDRRRWALYSNLRFVARGSLVAAASLVGVLALFPDALEELLVANTEISDPPAASCQQQEWWQLDRSCLSRRGMPWAAGPQVSSAVTVEVPSAAEGASEQALTENRSAAIAPAVETTQQNEATTTVETAQRSEVAAPQQETPAPPPVAEERQIAKPGSEATAQQPQTPAPVAEERQIPTQRSGVAAPPQDTPAPAPVAEERQISTQRSEVAAPQQETPAPPPVAVERHTAK